MAIGFNRTKNAEKYFTHTFYFSVCHGDDFIPVFVIIL